MSFSHNILDDNIPKAASAKSITPKTMRLIRETKGMTSFLYIVFFVLSGLTFMILMYSIDQWWNFQDTENYRYYAEGNKMSFQLFRSLINGGMSMILLGISGYLMMKYVHAQEAFSLNPVQQNMDLLLGRLRSYWSFTGVIFIVQVIYYSIIIFNSNS